MSLDLSSFNAESQHLKWHVTPILALGCLGSQLGRSQSDATEGGPQADFNNSMTPMLVVVQASSENYSTSNLTLKHRLNELYTVLSETNTD